MAGVLLDQYGGITETFHQIGENEFAIEMVSDLQSVVDSVKHLRETSNEGRTKSGDFYHIARIPTILVRRWNREYGVDVLAKENSALLDRLLDSPEFKALRIYQGKV